MPLPPGRALALAAAALLAACATRPTEVAGDAALVRASQVAIFNRSGKLATPPSVPARPGVHDVLLLSGGGSDGAFGAGVLFGWSESGDRPEFDIVTGVSTGALMATLAFLGPVEDARLKSLYTDISTDRILRKRGVFGLLSGSFFSRKPLEGFIAEIVDEALLDRVAAEHAKGRRLYVASTDLDRGLPVIWDMGKIAAGPRGARVALYRRVLAASAAVPGAFRPVYFDDGDGPAMHVDGGVKQSVLFDSYMLEPRRAGQNVWVIVNGQLRYAADVKKPGANAGYILGRSLAELMRANTYRSLFQTYAIARTGDARFHLAFIPDAEQPTDPLDFSPEGMRRLFEDGRAIGRAAKWANEPPRLERLERVR